MRSRRKNLPWIFRSIRFLLSQNLPWIFRSTRLLLLLFNNQWPGVVVVVFVVFVVATVAQWEGFGFPASAVTGFFAHIVYVCNVNDFWIVNLVGVVDPSTCWLFVQEWEDSVVNGTGDCACKSDQMKQIFGTHVSDVGNRSWKWYWFEIVRDDVSNDLGW